MPRAGNKIKLTSPIKILKTDDGVTLVSQQDMSGSGGGDEPPAGDRPLNLPLIKHAG